MKKITLLLAALLLAAFNYTAQAQVAKTAACTAGNLATVAANYLTTVTNLTVTGTIDARDFKTMRDAMPLLDTIDLSGTSVEAYTGTEGTKDTTSTAYLAGEIPIFAFFDFFQRRTNTTLKSIIFPTNITTIGSGAFTGCSGLSGSLNIPSSVTTIERAAFDHCSNLTGVLTIPASVTTIGDFAFHSCNGFTGSLTIPASVTTIGEYAFHYFVGSFLVDNSNPNYSSLDGILYNKDKTTLIQCPTSISGSLTIPASVTTIKGYAFAHCNRLTGSLTIPASVTTIEESALYDLSELTSIYALATTPINISKPVNAFYNVNNTIPLHVPAGSKELYAAASGWNYFTNIVDDILPTSYIVDCTAGNLATLAANYLTTVTKLTITGTIDARDFATMRDAMPLLESVDLSGASIVDFVEIAQEGAPSFISGNKNIQANGATNTIKGLAIYSSPANTIPANAFYNPITQVGKKSLLSITIPSTITAIGDYAFYDCTNLASIYAMSTTPIDISASQNVFYGVNKTTCILHVPANTKALYQAANQWQDFLNIVEDIATSVEEQLMGGIISVYPNPTTVSFVIEGINELASVTLTDMNGKLVLTQNANAGELIHISTLPNGVYIAQITTGGKTFEQKIVKK